MDKKEWRRRLRTLDDLSRYGQAIIDKLEEYDICNVTISKIIDIINEGRRRKINPTNQEICKFILNPANAERLIKLGQAINPIDTFSVDIQQRYNESRNNGNYNEYVNYDRYE